ncbi:MAG: hypothetical protein KBD21_03975 [Candidatus Pacebacteria bacterium]|nr:hypothetical protein [Candidatus Paceibacterota bacterium]
MNDAGKGDEVGDLQCVCPFCNGVLDEVVSMYKVFGITVVTERSRCRNNDDCGVEITTPQQSRRNKKVSIAMREFAEKRLANMLVRRGYYRVEPDGVCRELVDNEWPVGLCSQVSMSLDQCAHNVIVFVRAERAGCFVEVLGNGRARVLLDESFEKSPYDEDGDFDM